MRCAAVLIVSLAWLWCAALPATAEPVLVRSGEHVDFSRLVIYFDRSRTWSLGRSEQGYALQYSGEGLEFDMEEIFDRIPRTRIRALRSQPAENRVSIEIGCDCHADAFEGASGYVVIDIKDGPPDPANRFEVALGSHPAPPQHPQSQQRHSFTLGWPLGESATDASTRFQSILAANAMAFLPSEDLERKREMEQEASGFRAELIQQLSRASAQGLVLPNQDLGDQTPGQEGAAGLTPEPSGPQNLDGSSQSGSQSGAVAVSRQDLDRGGMPARRAGPATCQAEASIDVEAWQGSGDLAAELGSLRRDLVDASLRPDKGSAKLLAKLYISLGLGAEARQALDLLGQVATPEGERLRQLSLVVDGQAVANDAFPSNQLHCSGSLALWAALGRRSLDGSLPAAARAEILGAFSALPFQLRQQFFGDLEEKFRLIDDFASIESLRQSMRRGEGSGKAESDPISVAFDALESDDWPAAQKALAEAMSGKGNDVLRAARLLVDQARLRNEPLATETRTEIAALAFEHKRTPDGEALAIGLTELRALAGEFDLSFADLERLAQGSPARELGLKTVMGLLVERATDIEFARHVTPRLSELAAMPDPELRASIARRLLDLSLDDAARSLIAKAENRSADDRAVLAAVALRAGKAGEAEAVLGPTAGNAEHLATGLRIDMARSRGAQDVDRAAANQHLPEARRLLWRAGAIGELQPGANDPYSEAAMALRRTAPRSDLAWAGPPSLPAMDRMTEEIARRRLSVARVLELFPSPLEP